MPIEIENLLGKRLKIEIIDGRVVTGTFQCLGKSKTTHNMYNYFLACEKDVHNM